MATTTYTQQQLDALRAAISTGMLRVRYADRDVEYRSLNDMQRLEQVMMQALGQQSAKNRYSLASFTKQST
jgi:hypothetical protein